MVKKHILIEGAIKGVLMEADENCPYPYIQLDCSAEEFMAKVGAVSLSDFMNKISEKYSLAQPQPCASPYTPDRIWPC